MGREGEPNPESPMGTAAQAAVDAHPIPTSPAGSPGPTERTSTSSIDAHPVPGGPSAPPTEGAPAPEAQAPRPAPLARRPGLPPAPQQIVVTDPKAASDMVTGALLKDLADIVMTQLTVLKADENKHALDTLDKTHAREREVAKEDRHRFFAAFGLVAGVALLVVVGVAVWISNPETREKGMEAAKWLFLTVLALPAGGQIFGRKPRASEKRGED